MDGLGFIQLPAQTNVFKMLDEQRVLQTQQIDNLFADNEEEIRSKTRYKLNTLQEKYNIEREHIRRDMGLTPEQRLQKSTELNKKYDLAATTIQGQVQPDIDRLQTQKDQLYRRLEIDYAIKQIKINQIRELLQAGIIENPDVAMQAQLDVVGIDLPLGAFRPPKAQSPVANLMTVSYAIKDAEERLKDAKGQEAKDIAAQLADLKERKSQLLAGRRPELAGAILKSERLSTVGLRAMAGREPGTMAEGIAQAKKEPTVPRLMTLAEAQRGIRRIRVRAPNGQTGTVEEREWPAYKAQGFKRI